MKKDLGITFPFTFFFLEFEWNTPDRTLLNSSHQVSCESGDFVAETFWWNDGYFIADFLVGVEVESEARVELRVSMEVSSKRWSRDKLPSRSWRERPFWPYGYERDPKMLDYVVIERNLPSCEDVKVAGKRRRGYWSGDAGEPEGGGDGRCEIGIG